MTVTLISNDTLVQLSRQAKTAPRRRLNLNLHDDYLDPCQRLFNAVEPESYIRPHRHTDPPKPEFFLAVNGRLALLLFDDDGQPTTCHILSPEGPIRAAEVPAGCWHALIALTAGSVFFEAKPGPYKPLTDKDFAPWAPAEGEASAAAYLQKLVRFTTSSDA